MSWIPLDEVIFDDTIEVLHCDTRDFGCSIGKYENEKPYQLTEGYVFTIEQVKEILFKLYNESGGNVEWRMLSFEKDKNDRSGWDWKYIRVFKTDKGYGIGHSWREQMTFVKKQFFKHHTVNQKYLNAH